MDAVEQMSFVYRFGRRKYDLSSRTHIMGVLNVTPDSFSDGGRYSNLEGAVNHGLKMVEEGADIIDVGGESTRPKSHAYGAGSEPVPMVEELRRVLPVIKSLVRQTDVPISVDTYKAEVARAALDAGAVIVNDISGFHFDEGMPEAAAQAGASVVLMHIKGTPKTMQQNPTYGNLFGEIMEYLAVGLNHARRLGIEQVIIDPGIGFGKTQEHNLSIIRRLQVFKTLGCPILIGPSRKTFLGNILNLPVEDRLEGSLAAVVACILNGANIVRVHDVKEAKRAAMVADVINRTPA